MWLFWYPLLLTQWPPIPSCSFNSVSIVIPVAMVTGTTAAYIAISMGIVSVLWVCTWCVQSWARRCALIRWYHTSTHQSRQLTHSHLIRWTTMICRCVSYYVRTLGIRRVCGRMPHVACLRSCAVSLSASFTSNSLALFWDSSPLLSFSYSSRTWSSETREFSYTCPGRDNTLAQVERLYFHQTHGRSCEP